MEENKPNDYCLRVQEVLFDYMSSELGDKQSGFVREHLLHCPNCRKEAAEIEQTIKLLKKNTTPSPEHLSQNALSKIKRAILHPIIDWIYCHRHIFAIIMAILIITLLTYLACKYSAIKSDTEPFWINIGEN